MIADTLVVSTRVDSRCSVYTGAGDVFAGLVSIAAAGWGGWMIGRRLRRFRVSNTGA
jgi:hypothetical protein